MLIVETIARIRRAHLGKGVPIETIARELKVSRNTVRKVVRSGETAFGYERKVQTMPKPGAWVQELESRLEAKETKERRDRLSVVRMYEELVELGYGGSYDAVRRYAVAWHRRRAKATVSQANVPLVFEPGEAYQFDWSHEYAVLGRTTTKGKAAHVRLCYSRVRRASPEGNVRNSVFGPLRPDPVVPVQFRGRNRTRAAQDLRSRRSAFSNTRRTARASRMRRSTSLLWKMASGS